MTLPSYGKLHGHSHQWSYDMMAAGMPVVDIPGARMLVHVPTADRWFADRLRSRGRKVKAIEAA